MNILENDYLRVSVSPEGAELTSVFDKKNKLERLWSAEPDVWNRHAPILFPTVGRLLDNQYTYRGKSYTMPQHGFARDCTFSVIRENERMLSYVLTDSPETRANYPFPFSLQIDFNLVDNHVHVHHTVLNMGKFPMLFAIGGHPGFACPLLPGESLADYYIEFEHAETCARWYANEDGHIYKSEEKYLDDTTVIPYTDDLFSEDALVFKKLKSSRVSIKCNTNEHAVTMDYAGWPYLGIWSKAGGAPFICLEPWHGIADHVDHDGDLKKKEGMITLKPKQDFCCEYGLSFT